MLNLGIVWKKQIYFFLFVQLGKVFLRRRVRFFGGQRIDGGFRKKQRCGYVVREILGGCLFGQKGWARFVGFWGLVWFIFIFFICRRSRVVRMGGCIFRTVGFEFQYRVGFMEFTWSRGVFLWGLRFLFRYSFFLDFYQK